jgi:hypothetical protein
MFSAATVTAVAAALALPAHGAPQADPSTKSKAINNKILDAIAHELNRSKLSLRIKNAPPPYLILYKLTEVEVNDVAATLGAVTASKARHFVNLESQVHVGSYKFDNSNFVVERAPGLDGVAGAPLSLEPTPKLARRAAWLATDAAYKEALMQWLAKRNNRRTGGGGPASVASYTKAPPLVVEKQVLVPKLEDRTNMENRAKKISAVFRNQPHLRDSRVAFTSFLERRWYLNTEGTNATDTRRVSGVAIVVTAQAVDGQELALYYTRYGMTDADLPNDKQLIAKAKEMAATMTKMRKAPVMKNYTGPVLFEERGAAGIVRRTLANHLGGTPVPEGLEKGQAKRFGGALADRIGFRAISPLLSVVDDPTTSRYKKHRIIGGYKFDDEGTKAQKVDVIKNGKLLTLLTSRTPSKNIAKSNGHARRNAPGGGFHGSATNLILSARRGKTSKQLRRALLKEAKAQGLPYAIVIRQLEDSAITAAPELSRRELYRLISVTDVDAPPPALLAYRVYPNGREELVRGVRLNPVSMRAWRDVIGASRHSSVHNFLASGENDLSHKLQGVGDGFVPSSGVESAIVTPDLLFKELELVGSSAGKRPLPAVPRPK